MNEWIVWGFGELRWCCCCCFRFVAPPIDLVIHFSFEFPSSPFIKSTNCLHNINIKNQYLHTMFEWLIFINFISNSIAHNSLDRQIHRFGQFVRFFKRFLFAQRRGIMNFDFFLFQTIGHYTNSEVDMCAISITMLIGNVKTLQISSGFDKQLC